MKNVRSERGAITLLTLITLLFFMGFLITTHILATNRAGAQVEMTEQIRRIYYPGDIEAIYNSYFEAGYIVPIYTSAQLRSIGSGATISIPERGDRRFVFSIYSTYILMADIVIYPNELSELRRDLENIPGRLDWNGHTINGSRR